MSKLIILDAGHGGSDCGAVGVNGVKESHKVMSITNKVKALLESSGVAVKLTRGNDTFVSLEGRCDIERASKANGFVSIHCNAFNKSAKGLEVFMSGSTGSINLANSVYNSICDAGLYTAKRGVKSCNYYVVKNTASPAILIETAFIDNAEDIKLLEREQDFAVAIAKGICKWLGVAYKESSAPAPSTPAPAPSKPAGNDWVRRLQAECNAQGFSSQVVDGIAGANTLRACPTLREGARGNITKLLQERLVALGYNTNGVDGIFGAGTTRAVKIYQSARGLVADGIVGQGTWRKLLGL